MIDAADDLEPVVVVARALAVVVLVVDAEARATVRDVEYYLANLVFGQAELTVVRDVCAEVTGLRFDPFDPVAPPHGP